MRYQLFSPRWLRRIRRRVFALLPFPVMISDVRDVVYTNWIVPVEKIAGLVPSGVTLMERDGLTILTVLTYRHGHFGASIMGPLRKLCPSPLQSNWRLYVERYTGEEGKAGGTVLFIRNIFDSAVYVIGTRLFTDILSSRLASYFVHRRTAGGWETRIEDEAGKMAFATELSSGAEAVCPSDFSRFFASWDEAIRFLTLQDTALAVVEDEGALACSKIDLPIDPAQVEPLSVTLYGAGNFLAGLGVQGVPFCFRVPAVHFRALSDRLISPV